MVRTWEDRGALHRLMVRGRVYDRWERLALAAAAGILVVCDEQRDRLVALGVRPERITVIGNTPALDRWRPVASPAGYPGIDPDDQVILYSGLLAPIRGVDRLVKALPRVLAEAPGARLVVAGTGPAQAELKGLAETLGVSHRVSLLGWLDQAALRAVTQRAEVCTIPHRRSEHTETTYPNKLFEYLALGKPVVVSDCAPLARIVGEAPGGPAGRVAAGEDWAPALLSLLTAPERRRAMGARGARLVAERYNASRDGERLLEVYQRMGTP